MSNQTFKLIFDALHPSVPGDKPNVALKEVQDAFYETLKNLTLREPEAPSGFGLSFFKEILTAAFPSTDTDIPKPSMESVGPFLAWLSKTERTVTDLVVVLAVLTFEFRWALTKTRMSGHPLEDVIRAEMSNYAAWLQAERRAMDYATQIEALAVQKLKSLSKHVQGVLEKSKADGERIGQMSTESAELVIKLQKQSASATALIDAAQQNFQANIATMNERFAGWNTRGDLIEQNTNEAQSRLNAVKEGLATLSVKKLWDRRATSSFTAFWISALLLVVFLIVLPLKAFAELDAVLQLVRHIGDATTADLPKDANATQLTVATISRLVVITVPLALYFWIIRLLVRFNLHSLALMEDARQRHTMMDTYFHLIEKDAATKEDRALILNALFRPTPGQGGESVDPPNFLELLDKGMGKN